MDFNDARGIPRIDRAGAALVALFGLLYCWNLTAIELSDTDEGRSGVIVRDMVEGGQWLLPRTPDGYLCEKPLAYYGAAAILGSMFGINEWTLRGVSVAAALVCLWATWILARIYSSSRAAGLSVVLLGSNLLFLFSARQAMVDMTLACFVTLGLLCYFAARQGRIDRWPASAAAGAAFGLAILSKGPVGVVLPGAIVLSDALLSYGVRWKATRKAWGPVTLAGFLALTISMAWYLPGLLKGGGEFLETSILSENFRMPIGRAEGIGVSHRKPPYYYPMYQLIAFLPALPLLPTIFGWIRSRESDPARRHLGAWFVGGFALFMLVSNKRWYYLVPLQPAVAVALALAAERAIQQSPRRLLTLPAAIIGLLAMVASLGAAVLVLKPSLLHHWGREGAYVEALTGHRIAIGVATAVLLGTGGILWGASRRGGDAVLRASAGLAIIVIGGRVGAGDLVEAKFDHSREFVRSATLALPPKAKPVIYPPINGYAMEFYWPERLIRDQKAALTSEFVLVQRPFLDQIPDVRRQICAWEFRNSRKDVILLHRGGP
jgi:4-amino-4-deoxy-L-arabinose transferase-like glycosyltransferase